MKKSLLVLLLFTLFIFSNSFTQEATVPKVVTNAPKTEVKEEKKDTSDKKTYIKDKIKTCAAYDGLFSFYQDSTSGKMYMKIKENQIGKEFIHFMYLENGLLDAGRYFKGAFGDSKIIKFSKYYDRIEISAINTNFYFDKNNPLSKASNANINDAILASGKIITKNKTENEYLIEADDLFLSESLAQIKYAPNPESKVKNPFKLGKISKSKTKFVGVKNYPKNSDVRVKYVYDNPTPTNYGSAATSDPRSTSLTVQHSFIQVPNNNYKPRYDDPRVGYFTTEVTDQTSPDAAPYRDLIHRWNLVKKDPTAAISEPVTPITWWMENTTPTELRPFIREGVLEWNKAFETAGFKNAVVVKQQPDNANWDAGDIRYNVLRWTSSPRPPFGGYGPSFVNPRTGEILGADIMLEYVFLTNRLFYDKLYDTGASSIQDFMTASDEAHSCSHPGECSLPSFFQDQMIFGKLSGDIMGYSAADKSRLVEEGIKYLALHEVGHTLGLNHNMRSSQFQSYKEIHNLDKTAVAGLIGSVMDYPALNVSGNPDKQGNFYTSTPGPYDHWAIEFGYSPAVSAPAQEAARLEKILSRSAEPMLTFGNDADDMRSPGRGIDPTVMIGDLSDDAISYSIDRIKLAQKMLPGLKNKLVQNGDSYHLMRQGFNSLMGQQSVALGVISRYIGGVKIDRSLVGQKGATRPFTPISYGEQKRAMDALAKYAFSDDAFEMPAEILTHLQRQRRGFGHWGRNEDPHLHAMVGSTQKRLFAHLLHPKVLTRMSDSQLYGNAYSPAEMLNDLTKASFDGSAQSTIRQNLQITYVKGLISVLNGGGYDNLAKSAALQQMLNIRGRSKKADKSDESAKAHYTHIQFLIDKALDTD